MRLLRIVPIPPTAAPSFLPQERWFSLFDFPGFAVTAGGLAGRLSASTTRPAPAGLMPMELIRAGSKVVYYRLGRQTRINPSSILGAVVEYDRRAKRAAELNFARESGHREGRSVPAGLVEFLAASKSSFPHPDRMEERYRFLLGRPSDFSPAEIWAELARSPSGNFLFGCPPPDWAGKDAPWLWFDREKGKIVSR